MNFNQFMKHYTMWGGVSKKGVLVFSTSDFRIHEYSYSDIINHHYDIGYNHVSHFDDRAIVVTPEPEITNTQLIVADVLRIMAPTFTSSTVRIVSNKLYINLVHGINDETRYLLSEPVLLFSNRTISIRKGAFQ